MDLRHKTSPSFYPHPPQWRAGMTPDRLVEELDRAVKVPGLANVWVPPIRNRIDMLATGSRLPALKATATACPVASWMLAPVAKPSHTTSTPWGLPIE